jgi:hypothetical protein
MLGIELPLIQYFGYFDEFISAKKVLFVYVKHAAILTPHDLVDTLDI